MYHVNRVKNKETYYIFCNVLSNVLNFKSSFNEPSTYDGRKQIHREY
jgi:hypothetical protein